MADLFDISIRELRNMGRKHMVGRVLTISDDVWEDIMGELSDRALENKVLREKLRKYEDAGSSKPAKV
jgi:hypothetical protein